MTGLWESLDHEGKALKKGVSARTKEAGEDPHPSTMRGYSEKTPVRKPPAWKALPRRHHRATTAHLSLPGDSEAAGAMTWPSSLQKREKQICVVRKPPVYRITAAQTD